MPNVWVRTLNGKPFEVDVKSENTPTVKEVIDAMGNFTVANRQLSDKLLLDSGVDGATPESALVLLKSEGAISADEKATLIASGHCWCCISFPTK